MGAGHNFDDSRLLADVRIGHPYFIQLKRRSTRRLAINYGFGSTLRGAHGLGNCNSQKIPNFIPANHLQYGKP
jgi:hypothetical protein